MLARMKGHSFFAGCLMGLLLCLAPVQLAQAQSAELYAAYEKYQELNSQGRYQEAIPFAEEFVRLVEKELGTEHEYFAAGLNNLAASIIQAYQDVCGSPPHYPTAGAFLVATWSKIRWTPGADWSRGGKHPVNPSNVSHRKWNDTFFLKD